MATLISNRSKASFGLGILAALIACAGKPVTAREADANRKPASFGLIQWSQMLTSTAPITTGTCVSVLDRISKTIDTISPGQFSKDEIEKNAVTVIPILFDYRMKLLDEARPILMAGESARECSKYLRRALRHIRGVEDYIGFVGARSKALIIPAAKPFLANFKVTPPGYLPADMLMNPSVTENPGVRSGDILLSRGNAAASALIARMAEEDTQFSHLAFIYSPNAKNQLTMEAHIEFGSIFIPLQNWMSDGKSRTMLLRYNGEPNIATRAAQVMYDKISGPFKKKNPIKYDFAFDMNDHSRLFCSEIAREGYEVASTGSVMVPLFPSRISMTNPDLMNRLGISQTASFIPADMEEDPRFTVLGEWRDFNKVQDVWQKDAVLTSIYKWAEEGYKFDTSTKVDAESGIAKVLRNFDFIKDKMPKYMTRSVVKLNMLIENMNNDFQAKLAAIEAKRGPNALPLTYNEVMTELETIRNADGPRKKGAFQYFHK
jgi:hypothetical protein